MTLEARLYLHYTGSVDEASVYKVIAVTIFIKMSSVFTIFIKAAYNYGVGRQEREARLGLHSYRHW